MGTWKSCSYQIIPVLPLLEQFSLIGVCSKIDQCKRGLKTIKMQRMDNSKDMLNNSDVDVIYPPIGIHFETSLQSLKAETCLV